MSTAIEWFLEACLSWVERHELVFWGGLALLELALIALILFGWSSQF